MDDIELCVLTGVFDARPDHDDALVSVLARYVVLTRRVPGCRNVDLVASLTRPGRLLVIEKWESPDAVRAHLDSPLMADMAGDALGLLAGKPALDLYGTISAHDVT